MKYILDLDKTNRVLSATVDKYYVIEQVRIDHLPVGNLIDYKFIDGKFIYEPLTQVEKTFVPLKNETD